MTRLLDVNLLMALLWQNHEHHERARFWLTSVDEFATCPLSQTGFARISSHPMLGYGMTPEQAFAVLRRFVADPRHRFVPDDVSCTDSVLMSDRIPGANHVTDYYLAGLARQHRIALATFDGALRQSTMEEPGLVELVP